MKMEMKITGKVKTKSIFFYSIHADIKKGL